MTNKMKIIIRFVASAPLCLVLASCFDLDNNECNDLGERWCEDDHIWVCVDTGHGIISENSIVEGLDCSAYGFPCIEWKYDSKTQAGCQVLTESCPEGKHAICYDNIAVDCNETTLPVIYYLGSVCSASDEVCVEHDGGLAYCVPQDDEEK